MVVYDGRIELKSSGDVIPLKIESENYQLDISKMSSLYYIRQLIHSKTIRPRFRIYLLNEDESVNRIIPNEDIISGGSYQENYEQGQRKSLSFSLMNQDGKYNPSINSIWVGTKFSFEIGIETPDESAVLWFKKGVFVVKNINPSYSSSDRIVQIDCCDKFGVLEGKSCTFSDTLEIKVFSTIEKVINDILKTSKGNGEMVDPMPILYHPSFQGKQTPLTITEQAGSNYGSVILQLAEILSAEVFYNSEGNLTFVPKIDVIKDGDKPIIDDYVDKNGDYQNENFSFDFTSFVNHIVVIGGNINGHTCRAEKKNEDPESPLSVQRIGLRTDQIINDSNITTDHLAEERAEYELRMRLIAKTSQTTSVFFNPLLSVNNIVTFSDDYFNLKRERFVIQSLSYSLGYDGLMSLTNSNLNNLPFVNG